MKWVFKLGILLIALFAESVVPVQAGLEVDDTGRYFEDDGHPVVLFGGGLWGIIPNTEIDIEAHNAWLELWGANANRATLFAFFNAPDVTAGLAPWKRTGPGTANDGKPRFDLSQFDEAFWERLHRYLQSCEKHSIYTLLQIWDEPFLEGGESRWPMHPFNPANNVNAIPGLDKTPKEALLRGAEDVFYDPGNEILMGYQDALVRKLLDETAQYGNLIYEIGNEINLDSKTEKSEDWQQHWIDFFRAYERDKNMRLLLSNDTRRSLLETGATGFDVINNHGSLGLRIKGNSPGRLAKSISESLARDFAQFGKPVINSRPCSDPDRQRYVDIVSQDTGRCLFWSYFMGGGHIIGFRTTRESFMGATAAEQIVKSLRHFIDATNFWEMKPMNELVIEGRALCMATLGRQYAAYLPIGGVLKLDLRSLDAQATVRWYNPARGEWEKPLTIDGGSARKFTPPTEGDWALLVEAHEPVLD